MSESVKKSILFCLYILPLIFAPSLSFAEKLTMPEAVMRALRDNNRIAASEAGRAGAEEGRKAARGVFGPALSTSYGYTKSDSQAISSGQFRDNDYYLWSLEARQNLFSGFRDSAAYRKQALEAEKLDASLNQTRLDIVSEVQFAYLEYLKAGENVRSMQDSLTRLRAQLESTKAFYEVGLRPRLDVLQAEVDVSSAENELIKVENSFSTYKTRLDTLIGLGVNAPSVYEGSLDYVPFIASLDDCLGRAYTQRPDIHMAEKTIRQADESRIMAQSAYYPQISADFSWNTQGDHPQASGSELMSTRFTHWQFGLNAQWSLFEWGSTYYADSQAGFAQLQAKATAADLHEEVAYDVQVKLLATVDAAKRISVADKGLVQAKEAYRMALARYQTQVGTNTDVLDAQSKLTSAEAVLTSAKADYLTALSRLYVAMGEIHPDLSTPLPAGRAENEGGQ